MLLPVEVKQRHDALSVVCDVLVLACQDSSKVILGWRCVIKMDDKSTRF